jgi:malate synthase
MTADVSSISVASTAVEGANEVLTPDALDFVAALHRRFGARRGELLAERTSRARAIAESGTLGFLPETAAVREGDWVVAPAPADLRDRRVEITGPTDAKMTINALNSGANVWLADLEDANTPHWSNVVGGQVALRRAIRGELTYVNPAGKRYEVNGAHQPTIVMRPRGWHLSERHIRVDGMPVAGALVDFGLYFFHNAQALLDHGSGPYFYLPKLESHEEARLWNDVFGHAQHLLGIPHGSIRATVLIETITAAFEMDEILYELRDHAAGLNAGRWDYLFSVIKKFSSTPQTANLPDRNSVSMTAPFMRAYARLLVRTCHRRGAFAMGGMAAFIPSRADPEVNAVALAKVREDKSREARDGFDGSWVAHPDLVPVCRGIFDEVLAGKPNQLDVAGASEPVAAEELLAFDETPDVATEKGLRGNIVVTLLYLESWLRGTGAVTIHHLMEDAATAEISRSQIWQWIQRARVLDNGRTVTRALVQQLIDEQTHRLESDGVSARRLDVARRILEDVAFSADFPEFLTLAASVAID